MSRMLRRTFSRTMPGLVSIALLFGCSAADHREAVRDDQGERVTVGTVQRTINLGMHASDVAAVLGSPNIVTTDEQRRETWIWDKIATDVSYSRSSGTVVGLVFGGSGGGAGVGNMSTGAESSSQRTLTVIVKFDGESRVRDFSYRTRRF